MPSVEAVPVVFLTSRRLEARNASTDGMVAPRGLGRSPVWTVGGRPSGFLGATVPSVEAFLLVFLQSRRLDAWNSSTDGAVALMGRFTSSFTQREAQRHPPPPLRREGVQRQPPPPFRCAERGRNGLPGGLP